MCVGFHSSTLQRRLELCTQAGNRPWFDICSRCGSILNMRASSDPTPVRPFSPASYAPLPVSLETTLGADAHVCNLTTFSCEATFICSCRQRRAQKTTAEAGVPKADPRFTCMHLPFPDVARLIPPNRNTFYALVDGSVYGRVSRFGTCAKFVVFEKKKA